eukprot:g1623.t1
MSSHSRPLTDGDILMALRALDESRQKDTRKLEAYTTSWKYTTLEFGAECRYNNNRRWQAFYEILTTNPLEYQVFKNVIAFISDFLEDDELEFDDFPTAMDSHKNGSKSGEIRTPRASPGVTSITKEQFLKQEFERIRAQLKDSLGKDKNDASTKEGEEGAKSKKKMKKKNPLAGFGKLMAQVAANEEFASGGSTPEKLVSDDSLKNPSSGATENRKSTISNEMLLQGISKLKTGNSNAKRNVARNGKKSKKSRKNSSRPMSLNEELRSKLSARFAKQNKSIEKENLASPPPSIDRRVSRSSFDFDELSKGDKTKAGKLNLKSSRVVHSVLGNATNSPLLPSSPLCKVPSSSPREKKSRKMSIDTIESLD